MQYDATASMLTTCATYNHINIPLYLKMENNNKNYIVEQVIKILI
jgi:hypothetical protein